MKRTMKVQENPSRHNKYINIPKDIVEKLEISKGDTLLISADDNKLTLEKC